MSCRRADSLYAGARGRLERAAVAKLGPKYAIQPKRDGAYAVISTDGSGMIANITLRGGPAPAKLVAEFAGVRWAPHAVVVGEIEAYTEAALRAVEAQGYRRIHLFDALRFGGRDVSREPQRARRDLMMRAESELVQDVGPDRSSLVPDRSTFTWAMPTDGASQNRPRARPLHPPGAMRSDGPPTSWRRMPVVPQLPAARADEAWSEWVDRDGGEGLVVVALDAPLGRRGSKRKVKPAMTLDAVVVSVGKGAATVAWRGHSFVVSAASRAHELAPGEMVEVVCEGWYDGGVQPRCARIVRPRPDLRGTVAA